MIKDNIAVGDTIYCPLANEIGVVRQLHTTPMKSEILYASNEKEMISDNVKVTDAWIAFKYWVKLEANKNGREQE